MAGIGINIPGLVDTAASTYIAANAETFKSTVAGPQGAQGAAGLDGVDGVDADALTLVTAVNNGDYTMTLTFSDGTVHTTGTIRGEIGESVTVKSVVFGTDGAMTIEFSDGTIETSSSLNGADGRKMCTTRTQMRRSMRT